MSLTVYGHPSSQPARTVFWVCLLGEIPFKLAIGKRDSGFGLIFEGAPRGQVPWIQDGDFQLAECGAISWYLAEKHHLKQLFGADLQEQARVHQFIIMYPTLVRLATYSLMMPHSVKPLMQASPEIASSPNPLSLYDMTFIGTVFAEEDNYKAGNQIVSNIARFLEDHHFFNDSSFVCGGIQATAADLICYAEVGQLSIANLFDFSDYPKLTRWLAAMQDVPFHDVVNRYNTDLGDIRTTPNTWDRYWDATEKCVKAMVETGLVTLAE